MKRVLTRISVETYYYRNDKKILGVHENIRGNVSGINGDVSGIRGDVGSCKISAEERKIGVKIEDLLIEEA